MNNKFQPYKSCSCGWCKGSRQHMSRHSKLYKRAKQLSHRKFRRAGRKIDIDYIMPTFLSCNRWY